MIRFLPDNWRETILRPIAMAAPDAGVYIEIMAPDFRFVFILVLLALLVAFALLRRPAAGPARPALVVTACLVAAFVPWLATTANGRYFIAPLMVAGPLCIALAWLLPLTRGARLVLALLLVAVQGFAVQQTSPFQAWALAPWKEAPYFGLDLPADMRTEPATYVSMSNISYSLIAPQFPESARWMSLVNAPGAESGSRDGARAQAFLKASVPGRLVLLVPIVPGFQTAEGLPTDEVAQVMNDQMAGHKLSFAQPRSCRLIRSRGIARLALNEQAQDDPSLTSRMGFWACAVVHDPAARTMPSGPASPSRYEDAFRMVEATCPRFFAPGQTGALPIPGGEMRNYAAAEMKLYALERGDILYKYYRAFNPVRIGSIEDVRSGKVRIDCSRIRGRSGLPWEREI